MEFRAWINPGYSYVESGSAPSLVDPSGLLAWQRIQLINYAESESILTSGDMQMEYFVNTAIGHWKPNEDAEPSTPPFTWGEWIQTYGDLNDDNLNLFMIVTFGWYYMQLPMSNLWDREQLLINMTFWNVFVSEYGNAGKKKKKKKWIYYYLKPKWRF